MLMGLLSGLSKLFGGGQSDESNAEPVTNSDLSRALNALAGLEISVLSEAQKGKNEFAKIIKQFVEVQLKVKELQEIKQIGLAVAQMGNKMTPGVNARADLASKEIKVNEFKGATRVLIINIGLRIKAFEAHSPKIAQAMRDVLRYVMNKLAAEINMPEEHIKLAKSQGAWF